MDRGFQFLDSLSLLGPDFSHHGIQLGLHILVSHLGLGVPFEHLHLHFGELTEFLFFFLPGPVDFVNFLKSFFMDGLGLVFVKLNDILAGLFLRLDNPVASFLFYN